MKFYIIKYHCDGEPEGIGYEFAATKREANKLFASKKRDFKEHWDEQIKTAKDEDDEIAVKSYERMQKHHIAGVEIQEIEVPKGTVKEMVYWALQYQVI